HPTRLTILAARGRAMMPYRSILFSNHCFSHVFCDFDRSTANESELAVGSYWFLVNSGICEQGETILLTT
ncbi:MAG: hypothetical protein JXA10_12550, partial [Anaerolineae bacterium]|nr:hypothetical protein [Anaerolineae bacterium]